VALGTVRSGPFLSLSVPDYFIIVAGRTLIQSVISSLERIDYDGDPLQFLHESTTYQSFVSLFALTEMHKSDPTLKGFRACDHDYIYFPRHVIAHL
jgi:hypothetical protein